MERTSVVATAASPIPDGNEYDLEAETFSFAFILIYQFARMSLAIHLCVRPCARDRVRIERHGLPIPRYPDALYKGMPRIFSNHWLNAVPMPNDLMCSAY
ncbi:hypothetical protein C8R45DRAFT_1095987 [Mycena sanguinolenta]|nr:hypothetical protein C8R45DRAFT_1095987 [Mycena sanguinolenta]